MEDFTNMISVLNLPHTVADVTVREQFSVCGPVHWTSIVTPGCALVRFATSDSAQKAIHTFNGGTWAGQCLQVQPFSLGPAMFNATPKPASDNPIVDMPHGVDSPSNFTLPAAHMASPLSPNQEMPDLVHCDPIWNPPSGECLALETDAYRQGHEPQAGGVTPGEVINAADTEVSYDSTLGVWRSPKRDGRSEGWEGNSPENWTSAPMPTPPAQKPAPRPSREDLARMAAMSGYSEVQGPPGQQWSPQPQSPNPTYQSPVMYNEAYSRTASAPQFDSHHPRMSCDGQSVRAKSDADRLRVMKLHAQAGTPPGTPKSHAQSPTAMVPPHMAYSQAEMIARMGSNVTPLHMYRPPSVTAGAFTPVSPMYAAQGRMSMPSTPTMRSVSYSDYMKEGDLANMLTALQMQPGMPLQRQNSSPIEKPSPDVPAHLMHMLQNSRLAEAVANAPPGTDIMSLVASAELGSNSPMSPTKASSRTPSENWSQHASPYSSAPGALSPMLSGQVLQEFNNTRSTLVQLMLGAYQLLGSENVGMFSEKLTQISQLYDVMHELPVVQKRKKCQEMSAMKAQLMQDTMFVSMLQTLCTVRNHMYSLSRKVLFMNNGPEGIPIDMFLGSMSSDVYHLLKNNLPPEVCEFFTNSVPNPRLALLVFCEFASVDPAPVAPLTSVEGILAV